MLLYHGRIANCICAFIIMPRQTRVPGTPQLGASAESASPSTGRQADSPSFLSTGGDLCRALPNNDQLGWYHLGHRLALDVTRALHFLHSHEVQRFEHI